MLGTSLLDGHPPPPSWLRWLPIPMPTDSLIKKAQLFYSRSCWIECPVRILFQVVEIIDDRRQFTPPRTTRISGLKSQILKPTFLSSKWWWKVVYFEIPWAPSEIPANLPGQISLSGQKFLHWAAATLKGLVEFQNNFS